MPSRAVHRPHLHLILLFAASLFLAAADSWAALTWTGVTHRCVAANTGEVTARLDGIPWGQSWEDTCSGKIRGQRPPNLNAYGATGQPLRCEKDPGSTGIWGKWRVANDPRCYAGPRWEGFKRAGCYGPNRQVYSARLQNARDWDADCNATDTSRVAGKQSWGTPDRCVRDAFNTGIWGEWYTEEACATPLKWGSFKDNGCVKDMESADANLGNVEVRYKRSYSAVLYNAGGVGHAGGGEAARLGPVATGVVEHSRIAALGGDVNVAEVGVGRLHVLHATVVLEGTPLRPGVATGIVGHAPLAPDAGRACIFLAAKRLSRGAIAAEVRGALAANLAGAGVFPGLPPGDAVEASGHLTGVWRDAAVRDPGPGEGRQGVDACG
ncbi:MAG: hypothetical protein AAFX85_11990 [Pseudomonadota bacterium]